MTNCMTAGSYVYKAAQGVTHCLVKNHHVSLVLVKATIIVHYTLWFSVCYCHISHTKMNSLEEKCIEKIIAVLPKYEGNITLKYRDQIYKLPLPNFVQEKIIFHKVQMMTEKLHRRRRCSHSHHKWLRYCL